MGTIETFIYAVLAIAGLFGTYAFMKRAGDAKNFIAAVTFTLAGLVSVAFGGYSALLLSIWALAS